MAIILEDDALLTDEFAQHWRQYAATAPSDWSILQLTTNNDRVNKRELHKHNDYWINWSPFHWGTIAYVINRKGMKEILDKTYMRDQSAWELKEPHILVADELIYHFVSRTYTSTYPWIAGRDVDKGNYKALTFGRSTSRPMLEDAKPRDEIIAVVMSLRCEHEDDIIEGLETLKVDMAMLTRSNPKSSWFVNVVLVEEKLSPIFENHSVKLKLPSHHLHFFVSVNERRFNKFLFVPKVKVFLKDYEYVLFKDNDIPLSGFAWNTFMDLKKDAIIAGPFINKISKAFRRKWKMSYKQNEYVIFQDSSYFNHYNFNTYLDMSVFHSNLLEMQIVLMKTDFSLWFFDQIETYMDEEVNWGIDLMWCKAAERFTHQGSESSTEIPCALVSLDALDSDTKQINKSGMFRNNGFAAVQRYQSNPTFSKWIEASASMRPATKYLQEIQDCMHAIGEYFVTGRCHSYDNYLWRDLPVDVKDAAESIGFHELNWDNDSWPSAIDRKLWTDMSKNEIDALLVLGYSKRKWGRHLKSTVG